MRLGQDGNRGTIEIRKNIVRKMTGNPASVDHESHCHEEHCKAVPERKANDPIQHAFTPLRTNVPYPVVRSLFGRMTQGQPWSYSGPILIEASQSLQKNGFQSGRIFPIVFVIRKQPCAPSTLENTTRPEAESFI